MTTPIKYTLILFLCSIALSALKTKAQTPKNQKPTYFQAENGKLYWNIKLPVNIKLAFSKDSEKYNLPYKNKTNQVFFFTVEGLNTIKTPWAVDKETHKTVYPKKTVNFPIWVDGSAPKVKYNIITNNKYYKKNIHYVQKNTQLILTAKDKYSGVKEIYISINQAEFIPYSEPITYTKEGEKIIKYYAIDNVGNQSKIKTLKFVIDENPPTTKINIKNARLKEQHILDAKSKIYINSEDKYSGAKKIYYQINDDPLKIYTKPIGMKNRPNGKYSLKFYSIDNIGNKEPQKEYNFYLDKRPPMVTSGIVGDVYKIQNKTFFSGRTQLRLTGFDNKAGVETIKYSIDGKQYTNYKNKPIYLPVSHGFHTIKYYALDSVGNDSRTQPYTGQYNYTIEKYYIDLTGPEISYDVKGPKFSNDTIIYFSPKTEIIIKTKDTESGTDFAAYNFNKEQRENKYNGKIPLNNLPQGKNILKLYAYDNVSNRNRNSFPFFMDKTPPKVQIHFGSLPINNIRGVEVYPEYASVFISATDEHTDIKSISYQLNDQEQTKYNGAIRGLKKGQLNKLKVIARDFLENETIAEFQFYTQ